MELDKGGLFLEGVMSQYSKLLSPKGVHHRMEVTWNEWAAITIFMTTQQLI